MENLGREQSSNVPDFTVKIVPYLSKRASNEFLLSDNMAEQLEIKRLQVPDSLQAPLSNVRNRVVSTRFSSLLLRTYLTTSVMNMMF